MGGHARKFLPESGGGAIIAEGPPTTLSLPLVQDSSFPPVSVLRLFAPPSLPPRNQEPSFAQPAAGSRGVVLERARGREDRQPGREEGGGCWRGRRGCRTRTCRRGCRRRRPRRPPARSTSSTSPTAAPSPATSRRSSTSGTASGGSAWWAPTSGASSPTPAAPSSTSPSSDSPSSSSRPPPPPHPKW